MKGQRKNSDEARPLPYSAYPRPGMSPSTGYSHCRLPCR
jgi:hypothetical protein